MRPTGAGDVPTSRVVGVAVLGWLVLVGAQLGAATGLRAALDRQAYVSDLRLDSALQTFRPVDHAGLAQPSDPRSFDTDRNPRTTPSRCAPLTVLSTVPPVDGRSWTGISGRPAQPVNLLVVRFASAGDARAELDQKRVAMLLCRQTSITFPPFDAPATAYTVTGRHWTTSAAGTAVRWSLEGGGRRFDFYVRRYGNTLTWTYADDVSTPAVREEVADSLVDRLADLARR